LQSVEDLIAEITSEASATAHLTGRAAFAPAVLEAIRATDRAGFMPPGAEARAYFNSPHPIGHGQTISQPFIVALMTDLLDLRPTSRVLEVGTGSGYQAAILARLAAEVYSVEVIADLARRAETALRDAGLANVRLRLGDGAAGWPEAAPFDAIIVTAAARAVPDALRAQLAAPGRMVIPVGAPGGEQELRVLEKDANGSLSERTALPVAFVPLVRGG
jgi:protein-L-isoaspartate(D-aspartate) O-methyltransferase